MYGDRRDEKRRNSPPSKVYYPPIPTQRALHLSENASNWATGYEDFSGSHYEPTPANQYGPNVSDPRLTSMYDTSDPRIQADTAIGLNYRNHLFGCNFIVVVAVVIIIFASVIVVVTLRVEVVYVQ